MEGADAAPRFLEGLLEAMLQSFYDRFGGLSIMTKGCIWQTGVDGCAPEPRCLKYHGRSLEGADASFWPANVCLFEKFLGCALLFVFGSAGSPCFRQEPVPFKR